MTEKDIRSGQKATIDIVIKAIYGENAHILVGGRIVNVPLASLKLS